MKKHFFITAAGFITLGIVIGVIGLIGFKRTNNSTANEIPSVSIGKATTQNHLPLPSLGSFNQRFKTIAKESLPTVVSVQIKSAPFDSETLLNYFDEFNDLFSEEDNPEELKEKNDFEKWHPKLPKTPSFGSGSGVILSADGYIITNEHVIKSVRSVSDIVVTLMDKRQYQAELIGSDPLTDLAIIKINASNLPVVALGNSETVEVGEWVMAVGNPFELNSTVTAGIVSAKNRSINIIRDSFGVENFIQTDAAINPGNSGGALINLNGELIGINTAIASKNGGYQGYGFAVPINLARRVSEDIIQYGKVQRGYIGIVLGDIDAAMAKALNMDIPYGVLVQDVLPNSPGKDAGLKQMDIILQINGQNFKERNELQAYVASKKPGDRLNIKLWRESGLKEINLKLKPLENNSPAIRAVITKPKKTFGLEVQPLSLQEKNKLKLSYGVKVKTSHPYGQAYAKGILKDDIILEINQKPIQTVDDFTKSLLNADSGKAFLFKIRKPFSKSPNFLALEIP